MDGQLNTSETTAASEATTARQGALYGLGAYLLWGAMPFYFLAMAPAGVWEILAHRILWSVLLCVAILACTRQIREFLAVLRDGRNMLGLTIAGVLIAANWTIYLVAVTSGHVTEAALGYFLNPLVSVALGLVVLRETLRPGQTVAVVIGGIGGIYLAIESGSVPWIAFGLAFSFGIYGLVKKRLGTRVSAVQSLTAETAVLAPFAAGLLVWLQLRGDVTFTGFGLGHAALLVSAGLVTTVPLMMFAAAARRITLVAIGLMQFIAPILQFVSGLALGEHMSHGRWIGFGIVWVALVVLVLDATTRSVQQRRLNPVG